jgi:hypothetical protein
MSSSSRLPLGVEALAEFVGLLGEAGVIAARRASRATFRAIDRRGGKALPTPPIADSPAESATPLWDVFRGQLRTALAPPNAKARLARYLGVPRQRVTDYLNGRRLPDGEMTLRLLHWLAASHAGHDPSFLVAPDPDQFPPGKHPV